MEGVLSKVFPNCSSKDDVCDKIRQEWRVYQMEVIPDSNFIPAEETQKPNRQISYWEKAFQLADLPVVTEKKSGLDVDMLIISLGKILDDTGSQKFPFITSLFKAIASISHGNSAPENGFSINKHMLQLHGSSIQAETIEALRFVKDTILSYGGILKIPITKSLLESAKLAYSRYNAELEAKRKLQKEEEARKIKEIEAQEKKKRTENEREIIIASIQQVSFQNLLVFTIYHHVVFPMP